MAYTYRLKDDGTVQVRYNGAWLSLEEVLSLKDRQLRESREEVLELEREREAAEAEKNAPKPPTGDEEYEEIEEFTFGGDRIVYSGRPLPNSGTYTPKTITTSHTNTSLIASGGWSVPPESKETFPYPNFQVSHGGITYNETAPKDANDAKMRGMDVSYMTFDEAADSAVQDKIEENFIKKIKNKLDKW